MAYTYKGKKEIVRKYYKYGTNPNVTIVGSPTISNGVISNLGNSNYAQVPYIFNPNGAWSFVFKFKTSSISTRVFIIGDKYLNAEKKIIAYVQSGGHWEIAINKGDSSGSYFCNYVLNNAISVNTWYYCKIEFTGSEYRFYLSQTENFGTPYYTKASTVKVNPIGEVYIGAHTNTSISSGYAYVDLTKTYIKVDGSDWWHGTLAEESTSSDYDFYRDEQIYSLPHIITTEQQDTLFYCFRANYTAALPRDLFSPSRYPQRYDIVYAINDGKAKRFGQVSSGGEYRINVYPDDGSEGGSYDYFTYNDQYAKIVLEDAYKAIRS